MDTPRSRSIPVDAIIDPGDNVRARVDDDALHELARSIQEIGQLQDIGVVAEGNRYRLIFGFRRYYAFRLMGREYISSRVLDQAPNDVDVARLTENTQRENLTPTEEAIALNKLQSKHGLSVRDIAQRMGKSEGWVRIRLQLLSWPEDIITRLSTGEVSLSVGGHLAAIGDPIERARLTHIAIENGASARTVMAWRAAWESSQVPLTPEELDAPRPTPDLEPLELMFPCWSCSQPQKVQGMQVIRLCPACFLDLNRARNDAIIAGQGKEEEQ